MKNTTWNKMKTNFRPIRFTDSMSGATAASQHLKQHFPECFTSRAVPASGCGPHTRTHTLTRSTESFYPWVSAVGSPSPPLLSLCRVSVRSPSFIWRLQLSGKFHRSHFDFTALTYRYKLSSIRQVSGDRQGLPADKAETCQVCGRSLTDSLHTPKDKSGTG